MQQVRNILAVLPEYSPSTIINVVTPLKLMHEMGLINLLIRLQNEVTPTELSNADAIVLSRNWHPSFRSLFELALKLDIPIIYDLDDHVLAAPEGSYTNQIFRTPRRREMLEWLLRKSTLVRVHSPVLQTVIREYNANTQLVWAPINWKLVPSQLPTISFDPVHIVYAAHRDTGEVMYRFIQQDLHMILDRYGAHIRLHFLGYKPPDLCRHPLVTCLPFESDYTAFFSHFTRFGYTIGLAPMIDDLFHNCKTNVKFRDYAAAGAAGIYANTPLYRGNGVIDGETGLLVSGEPGSWLPALTQLIEKPSLVEDIRHKAREYAEHRYHIDIVTRLWMVHLDSLPSRRPLTEVEQTIVQSTRWAFTYVRKPDSQMVARLRAILREILPVRWRLYYYDIRQAIRNRLHR